MGDISGNSYDNDGVDTNGEDDADFGDSEIKADCGNDSGVGGSSDINDIGATIDDGVVDTNGSNNADCADGKSKVAINAGTAGDDDNDE